MRAPSTPSREPKGSGDGGTGAIPRPRLSGGSGHPSPTFRPVEGAKILGAVSRRGGDHRRVPAPYPPAARRLSLRPAGDHIPSDVVVPASLLATTRRQPAPGGRRGQDRDEEPLQVLRDRLLSRRHRRSRDQRREAPSCAPIFATSSTLTISPAGSRPSKASRHTSSSANAHRLGAAIQVIASQDPIDGRGRG